jgi:hypothetical protein
MRDDICTGALQLFHIDHLMAVRDSQVHGLASDIAQALQIFQ